MPITKLILQHPLQYLHVPTPMYDTNKSIGCGIQEKKRKKKSVGMTSRIVDTFYRWLWLKVAVEVVVGVPVRVPVGVVVAVASPAP